MKNYTLNATTAEQHQDIIRSKFLKITVGAADAQVLLQTTPQPPQNSDRGDFRTVKAGQTYYVRAPRKTIYYAILYKTATGTSTITVEAGNEDFFRAITRHLYVSVKDTKLADIAAGDTATHYLTGLAALLGETRKIVAIQAYAAKITGTGYLWLYSNEYTSYTVDYSMVNRSNLVGITTDRIKYAQSVATDTWSLYCMGYFVEVSA